VTANLGDGPGGRAWRWVVVGACAPLFVCSQFYRVANAVVAPYLERDLGLSSESLGALSAAFFYAFAVMQIPLALAIDRLGARRCMAGLSLVSAAGAVVFATAGGRATAIAGEVLIGVGMAGNLVGSMKLIGQWFSPREFATVAGAFAAVGTLGNVVATTPLALLLRAVGWRHAFVACSAATAALALLFAALVRERTPAAPPPPRSATAAGPRSAPGEPVGAMLRQLLATRDYWLMSLAAFCRYGSFVAIQGLWAGPYLIEIVGVPPVRAANLILVLNLSFVVGAPLGGWLSDRLLSSRKKLVVGSLVGVCACQVALALATAAPAVPLVAAILATLGLTSAFGHVLWAHIKEAMPARMAGMAMAGVNFFGMLGAAAFLHATGWVLDALSAGGLRTAAGYRTAFAAAACVVALALALYSFTRDAPVGGEPRDARQGT
jgi:nitrate/nitrite transporter NarK